MKKDRSKLHYLVKLALMIALIVVMDVTGLAMLPLPGQYASIMTVPVAVGAMTLGPLAGAILGLAMGCVSFITALKTGFSTLILAGYTGADVVILSLLNTIVPRVLMGLATGYIFKLVQKVDKTKTICYYAGGLAAPLLNTLLYMTILILVFWNAPTLEALLGPELMRKFQDNIFLFCAAYVGVQALIEAAIGCFISGSVCKVLRLVIKQ